MVKIVVAGAASCVLGVSLMGCQTHPGSSAAIAPGVTHGSSPRVPGESAEARLANHSSHTYARTSPGGEPVTKTEVIAWTQVGLSDEVIIDRIERSGGVAQLSAADLNELRDRGVHQTVIDAMRSQVP